MLRKIKESFGLPLEENIDVTLNEIKDGIQFTGHNMWLLFFAMIMACIGLTNNNITAIIGSMLISPLMGPVVGIAFGLSISDKISIYQSFRNYVFALLISLCSSTIFFLISPFHNSTNILNDYTHPTIFDVMLAFFGGLAGFLGIIKKDGTKVIAGVAVATSCMPPLCSAGYGLANLNWQMFLGGLYFYIINSFFIGVGSQLLIRWMQLPKIIQNNDNEIQKTSSTWLISMLSIILMLPSIWIAYDKWKQQTLNDHAQKYIEKIKSKYPDLIIVEHRASIIESKEKLEIVLLNDSTKIHPKLLIEANALDKMDINWKFVKSFENSELQQLQLRLKNVEEELVKLNNKN
ncbi:MAG: DUF389 domain-containing protein [Saprospirales bacterium]|nr:DUF389 domain-containing protein [Saprospirales bacterium]